MKQRLLFRPDGPAHPPRAHPPTAVDPLDRGLDPLLGSRDAPKAVLKPAVGDPAAQHHFQRGTGTPGEDGHGLEEFGKPLARVQAAKVQQTQGPDARHPGRPLEVQLGGAKWWQGT